MKVGAITRVKIPVCKMHIYQYMNIFTDALSRIHLLEIFLDYAKKSNSKHNPNIALDLTSSRKRI